MAKETLLDLIRQAVSDIAQNGFSWDRVKGWQRRIEMALQTYRDTSQAERRIAHGLRELFARKTTPTVLAKVHPGVDKVTLRMIAESHRGMLDDRIRASVDLIRLNRERAISRMLDRFAGWSTSIPSGGSSKQTPEIVSHIAKPLRSMSYEERRLYIEQGHKMIANVNAILAEQSNAIVVIWRSHYRQAGYDYREDHKERDGKFYAIRGNWAMERGFMKLGGHQYIDEITQFGEEINCRCFGIYLSNLRDLPDDMLTLKGKAELNRVKVS